MRAAEKSVMGLASCQLGVFTLAQARARGMTLNQVKRRLRAGRWSRVLPSVYAVEGAPESWRRRLKAAALWFGPRCVFSHRTAAALWGLTRFEGEEGPAVISATCHRPEAGGVRVVRVRALLPREVTFRSGFRVTSIERTLLDLAAEESDLTLETSVDDALRLKLTTVERLEAFLERRVGARGIPALRRVVSERAGRGGVPESELEARVLALLDESGLPRPSLQQKVRAHGRRYRLDFRFEGVPVVIEADGYAWHSTVEAFEADRRRINALTARGYRVLRWTWAALDERPDELLDELREVLQQSTRRRAA